MRIGIDARFVGPEGTGLGKYTEKLVLNLAKLDSDNQYFIFLKKSNWDYLALKSKNFEKVPADVSWYSLDEQLKMPQIYKSKNLDLVHIPHFNAAIFYRENFVVTIHDLIHHHFKEQSTTTKSLLFFKLKRFGYQIVIQNAIKRSSRIIVPSNFVKQEILHIFKVDPAKVTVTYEAAEEEYFNPEPLALTKEGSTVNRQPKLIYVGNAYPHKNLERLLDAFKILTMNHELSTMNLLLVCPRNVFSRRLKEEIEKRELDQVVQLKGYLKAGQLSKLFRESSVYVFPSLSEGFGIPGLNAMASGLPVTCSDIPTLKEVYGDAALYFDPMDSGDIAFKIKKILTDDKIKSDLINKGQDQFKKYSWRQMAKQTLKVYESQRHRNRLEEL